MSKNQDHDFIEQLNQELQTNKKNNILLSFSNVNHLVYFSKLNFSEENPGNQFHYLIPESLKSHLEEMEVQSDITYRINRKLSKNIKFFHETYILKFKDVFPSAQGVHNLRKQKIFLKYLNYFISIIKMKKNKIVFWKSLKMYKKISFKTFKSYLKTLKYSLIAILPSIIFKVWERTILEKIDNEEIYLFLEKQLRLRQIDVVLIFTTGGQPIDEILLRVSLKLKIKSIYIIDNWDNVYTRRLPLTTPSTICTFSNETTMVAQIKYQKYAADKSNDVKFITLGSLRMQNYPNLVKSGRETSKLDRKYILYVGVELHMDDYSILNQISKILLKNKSKLSIKYRPYPRTGSHINIEKILEIPLVQLSGGTQILNEMEIKPGDIRIPSQVNLEEEIINSLFVIGGCSTLLLESLALSRKYIALVHKEGFGLNDPYRDYCNQENLWNLKKLKNVKFVHNLNELNQLLTENINDTYFENDFRINDYITISSPGYQRRLARIIQDALQNS